jgi:methionyl-tRNA synthetase
MDRILVAVAWPYANGPFHIGHLAGAYLPADIFARYHRLQGHEVLMVSGSDMHGTPVLVRAEEEGTTAEAIARRYDAVNRASIEQLGLSYDIFTTTRTPLHERTVHEVFLTLLRNGYIDRRTEDHPYCPKHARFLPDRYLRGTCPHCGFEKARGDECDNCGRVLAVAELLRPVCALCGTPAEFRPSEHFYLRLDKFAEPLERYLEDKKFWRANVITFAENFRRAGLRPTPVTRDIDWGIPIPLDGYPSKRFYVWFDAVIGYLSATREWAIRQGKPEAWRRYWAAGEAVRSYYFVGKDNIYHHTLFWPAMLLGQGQLLLPYDVPANEWLVIGGGKLSKSRSPGQDVSLPALLAEHPPDAIRFYAALLAPQNHDTEFTWEEFRQITEEMLPNQWGNLVQRVLVFARDRFEGRIPEPPPGWSPESSELGARLRGVHARITEELEAVRLKEALELAMAEVRDANKRFHDARPWQAEEPERRRAVYEALWFLRAAATWLAPFLPRSSAEVFRMLGRSDPPGPGDWSRGLEPLAAGAPLGEVRPLYPKRSPAAPAEARAAAAPPSPTPGSAARASVPLDVRSGEVRSVAPHPSADKLYQLEVDLGPAGRRTVVAGLRPYLAPEALLQQRILLLANLQPRTIRSVTSHGMLLAADAPSGVALLHPPAGAPLGARLEGVEEGARTITIEEFAETPLRIARTLGPGGPGRTRVDLGDRTAEVEGSWPAEENLVVRTWPSDTARVEPLIFPGRGAATTDASVPAGAKVR